MDEDDDYFLTDMMLADIELQPKKSGFGFWKFLFIFILSFYLSSLLFK